jgi:formamidopyrimidine-DNA glycosylase
VPELPEVEITRRQIAPLLLGRTVAGVEVARPSPFFLTPPARLRRALTGRRFEMLERHGKYLLAHLDDGATVMLHLGMTGQLFGSGVSSVRLLSSTRGGALTPETQDGFVPDQHTHLRLRFTDGGRDVLFRDVRKFGKVEWLPPGKASKRVARLGPDALAVEGALLREATRRRRVAIKTLLLDQSVLAGVGNIYADEALFLAGIRPTRSAARLSAADCERLAAMVRQVLFRSIETGGSSISDYMQPDGGDGSYQDERHVYGRTGELCKRCQTAIRRRVLGGRSSHWCPRCQR